MPLTCANLGSNIRLRFPLRLDAPDYFLPVRMHSSIYRTGVNLCQRLSDNYLNHNCDMGKTFGERVRLARKALKLTQAQLGKKAGLSQTTIGDIERGRNDGSKEIVPLAKALNRTPDYLLYGTDDIAGSIASQVSVEQSELWSMWALLLPEEKSEMLDEIRKRAKHNQKVLAQHAPAPMENKAPPAIKKRTIVISERRKSQESYNHADRRGKRHGK